MTDQGPTRRTVLRYALVSTAFLAVVALAGRRVLSGLRRVLSELPQVTPPVPAYLDDFKINTVEGEAPAFDPARWRLVVDGLVEHPLSLDFAAVEALPVTGMTRDFHCVEGWSVDDVAWEGVRVSELLERAAPSPKARYAVFRASGGVYTDALTLSEAREPDTVLVYRLNGKELDPRQGRPIRLVIPSMYGYKGPKWVERIELVAEPHRGYWEERGYPSDARLSV